MEAFWRDLISHGAGLRTNSNLIGWLKGWAVIPSLSVVKGYNRHKNGFPKMTLSVMFLTKTNFVIKDMPLWQTMACGMSYSICIFPPLADASLSLDFLKYSGGMIPSWIQLRSAPESIKAMTSNSNSLLMTILTWECHLWKLTLLMVSKNKPGLGSWIGSSVDLTDWLSSSSEGLTSLL